ncbi:MAG: hypothetical protein KC964_10415 [Candidatus Omnitrophica bacterium]|nr:hypothetical protein [Candidatus Omnitrophota bacterium]
MHEPLDFYRFYLVDHYLYKVTTLKNIYAHYDALNEGVLEGLTDVVEDDYRNTLRAEIRATYFQSVETLFSLIFALEPKNNQTRDREIWYTLATSDIRRENERIRGIAKGEDDFLSGQEITVTYQDGARRPVSNLEYVFFHGVDLRDQADRRDAALIGIRKALEMFAKDFSDRGEFNAIKHKILLFPTITSFDLKDNETKETILHHDLSDSLTVLRYIEKGDNKKAILKTRPFDVERDYNMTILCDSLIKNIVLIRRAAFFDGETATLSLALPNEADVSEMGIHHKKPGDFCLTIEQGPKAGIPESNNQSK